MSQVDDYKQQQAQARAGTKQVGVAAGSSAGLPPVAALGQQIGGVMELGMSFMASRVVLVAVEMGVCSKLAAAPQQRMTLTELTSALGIHQRSARDFFDALVGLHILERQDAKDASKEAVYFNSPAADAVLDEAKPAYLGGLLSMCSQRLFKHWYNLPEALRTGQPQNEMAEAGSKKMFEQLYSSPERLEAFLKAMTGASSLANKEIARQLVDKRIVSKFSTFVDAGCAQGDFVQALCIAAPHLKGIGLDLPQVQPIFQKHMALKKLSERTEFAAVNFFEQPIPRTDLVFFGHILHDWGLKAKKQLLRSAHAALNDGGVVVLYEHFIDSGRGRAKAGVTGLLMSLNMLIETSDGFDYSPADAEEWLTEAGFRNMQQLHLEQGATALVAFK